ncbi:hypothetical protein ACJJTC_004926 [Scirpophaga incertulas]
MEEEIDLTLPLTSYSYEFKSVISKLDPKKVLTAGGPTHLLRDWRGLAYLLNIPNEVSNGISELQDKTVKVLDIWIKRHDGTATLENLLNYLAEMDRYDIYDDIMVLAKCGKIMAPVRSMSDNFSSMSVTDDHNETMIITHDDRRNGKPNYYHAYVLFAQDDWPFVRELLARMKVLNYKLCTEFDIEVGYGTQYAPVAQLILERCHRIILVYSPAFLKSPANNFYSNYAQAVGIETNKRNIIPIVYKPCTLPHNLMYYHRLVYNEGDDWVPYDFWKKLAQTLDKVKLANSSNVPPVLESAKSTNNLHEEFLNDKEFPMRTVPALPHTTSEVIVQKKKSKQRFTKMFNYISSKLK